MYGNNDPNEMVICPYNDAHRISAKKFPYHLPKCRKQYASGAWKNCPFHFRHEVPVEEYDYHLTICEYKDTIRQDLEEVFNRDVIEAKRMCQPQPTPTIQPDSTEDWESEAVSEPFSIARSEPSNEQEDAYDIVQAMQEVQLQAHAAPSRPVDTSGLTATQKKNLKRSQKRQEKREAEENTQEPQITDEERIQAIATQYAVLTNKTSGGFVDFLTILNQYCQKSRINVPKYSEVPGVLGGYGAQVFVKGQIFTNMKYCATKKEAKHDAAKVALLGLNIPVVDPTPNKPMAARTATDHQRLRETHELHLLNQTGQPQPRGRGLGQPVVKPPSSLSMPSAGPPVSQQPSQNGGDETAFSLPEATNGEAVSDEWTAVTRKGVKNSVYQHSLKMAGRGRGMIRK
ncbi:factor1-like [Porites harrisoni]